LRNQDRVARAEKDLDDTQLLLQNNRDNGHLLMLDKQQRLNLVNLKLAEKMFFGQKLKCDKGTRFFHSLMSQRHRRNHIPAILRSDGLPTTSVEEVDREFVTYYKELLGTPKPTLPPSAAVVHCGPCINTDSHGFQLAPVTVDDIKQALFSIGDDKTQAWMGIPLPSSKKLGILLVENFVQPFKISLPQERFSSKLFTLPSLVPKAANANSAADYIPISCCNVTYKVISKILAGRLAHVLNDIINPFQNAFLGGRYMPDNINLMQEFLRQYGWQRVSPRCTIKIDFKKAFDSVQ
jgi:hypothetical protein